MLPREEWPEVDRLLAGEKPSMKPYTFTIEAGGRQHTIRRTHRIRPGWRAEGQISDTKVWIAEGEGFRFAEVILGKEDRKRFFEGSTQERGDVGEKIIAQCFRLVFGDRTTPLKTAEGKPNLGISDVEISIDGKLYPTEVKARTYGGPGTPLSIEAARRTLFNAMKGLARHFNLDQYREAERGFIGLVLIRPDEGTGEVALISVDRRDQSHMEVMLGRPWITKLLDMWNKPEVTNSG
jgi:hypothetical protein